MVHCLNPACPSPANPSNPRFCQSCGVELNHPHLFRNRYCVVKVLGQGAFGRTYQAQDIECLHRPCVIKKFIARGEATVLQKSKALFAQEAQRLYELDHPQIPRLYAYFEQDDSMYLVQQFIEGENLLTECAKQGRFSQQKIRKLLQSLLPVLQYIHDRGVLHRDIKPENIMRRSLSPPSTRPPSSLTVPPVEGDENPDLPEFGQLKDTLPLSESVKTENTSPLTSPPVGEELVLIDFGGAKQVTGTVQGSLGTAVYTPGYAAFEQLYGQHQKASDLYSLAATCVRLLTRCFPHQDACGNIRDEIYDSGAGCWRWREYSQQHEIPVGEDLGQILDKLLEPFAQKRYQSAEEVLAALNTAQSSTVSNRDLPKQPRSAAATRLWRNPGSSQLSRAAFLKWAGFTSMGAAMAVIGSWLPSMVKTLQEPGLSSPEPSPSPPKPGLSPLQSPTSFPPTESFEFEEVTANEEGEIVQRQPRQAEFFREDLGNGVSLEMVPIEGGSFWMGSPETEEGRSSREGPRHEVNVRSFFMGQYPVTQGQYQAVMGDNPSKFKGNERPIEQISWNSAVEFCKKLSKKTGRPYRLPSEAEWEYACRAEMITPFYFGTTITTDLVNYDGNFPYRSAPKGVYRAQTTDVGSFPPNGFGLSDLHGNVWEWCADYWHGNYEGAPDDGTAWLNGEARASRVVRGGSWSNSSEECRSASRLGLGRDTLEGDIGFRVVVSDTRRV